MDEQRRRVDMAWLKARFGRHPVTIDRWVKNAILAPPHRLLGRKVWWLDEVEAAEARLQDPTLAPKSLKRAQMLDIASKGRAARASK